MMHHHLCLGVDKRSNRPCHFSGKLRSSHVHNPECSFMIKGIGSSCIISGRNPPRAAPFPACKVARPSALPRARSLQCPFVLLAMGLLVVHAAVLDEAAGRAVLQLDGIAGFLAAVGGAGVSCNASSHFAPLRSEPPASGRVQNEDSGVPNSPACR